MNHRRMFSNDIVSSDAFLEMSPSTQALYFHLAMRADDDGFVNPRVVMRMIGSTEDEIKVLLAKRFILAFDSGVVVIKHWLIHNLIRADLYKETLYKKEKSSLGLNEYGAYTELREGVLAITPIETPKWLKIRRKSSYRERTANGTFTALRIGKVSIGNNIYRSVSPGEDQEKSFSRFWEAYPKKEKKKQTYEIWKRKKLTEKLNDILLFVEKAKLTDRWKNGFVKQPTTFLNGECWNDDLSSYNDLKKQNYQPIIIE